MRSVSPACNTTSLSRTLGHFAGPANPSEQFNQLELAHRVNTVANRNSLDCRGPKEKQMRFKKTNKTVTYKREGCMRFRNCCKEF